MVANLSGHKAGWDDRWEFFSQWAEKGQAYKKKLLYLVDEDTNAFNKIIDAFRMPKSNDNEIAHRKEAIESATKYATEIPFEVMQTAYQSMEVTMMMLQEGLQNSLSDAGVGILCARAAVAGAYFNVRINAKDLKDRTFAEELLSKASKIYEDTLQLEAKALSLVNEKI